MKRKLYIITLIMTFMFIITGINVYAATEGSGNISNGGYAVADGNYVYYAADGNLYRENINGGSKKILLEENIISLAIYDDYIYYCGRSAISRIKKDGSGDEFIAYGSNLIVNGNYLYYNTNIKGKNTIVKRRIGASEEIALGRTEDAFVISKNKIYFNNEDSDAGAKGLASMDLDGGSFKSYYVGQVGCIQVYNEYIYYTDSSNIYKISVNGGDAEMLLKDAAYYINVYDGYIYYRGDGGKFDRISVNGKKNETSGLKVYSMICIVADRIYGRSPDGYQTVSVDSMPSFKSEPTGSNNSSSGNTSSSQNQNTSANNTNQTSNNIDKYNKVSDWAKDEIADADKNGLIPEYFIGKDLTRKITRAEFASVAVLLYEKLAKQNVSEAKLPFSDIKTAV